MTAKARVLSRIFRIEGGKDLIDPNPSMSVEEVKKLYIPLYPELNTMSINETLIENDSKIYIFKKSIGTKG